MINEFSKGTGYKVNIQKSVAFLYTIKIAERNLKNIIYDCTRKIKHLGIKLTQEVKDLYSENENTDEKN